jgi:aspartyl-tRNA(Asn)/glutamyl-tRNA(Gln) amidotransferase subunit A
MITLPTHPSISQIHSLYRQKESVPTEVYRYFFELSRKIDEQITAVFGYSEVLGMEQAQICDNLLAESEIDALLVRYPLFGIPYFLKSNIMVTGQIMNAGTKALDGFKSPYDAVVYQRIQSAGATLLGFTNMDELASGASGEHSYYGVTRNPYDITRVPGGSSSGSCAAVGSGQCVFALGSDTGGSIRQPSAFCGTVGLKPTYGLVPRYGVHAMASSFDQVGAITNTVADNETVMKVLAGKDEHDQTAIESEGVFEKKVPQYLKIGIPDEFYIDGIDPKIRAALDDIQHKLEAHGHQLIRVSLPLSKYAISVYYITMTVEFAANQERLDGVRFAQQKEGAMYYDHRGEFFGDEPVRRTILGAYVSSAGYYDAYYNRAQKVKELARREFAKAFETVDVMLTPTTPEFPFKIGEKTTDPLKMYLSDVFTCMINPLKIPGLNVPLGLFDVDGVKLPTGCQILGPEMSEATIYALARDIEMIINSQ